jgi:hypothetical protein
MRQSRIRHSGNAKSDGWILRQRNYLCVDLLWAALLKMFLASLAFMKRVMSPMPDSLLTITRPWMYLLRGSSPGSVSNYGFSGVN